MKKLFPYFFAVLMALFIIAVAGAVLYYSYNAVSIIFPGDLMGQLFGMTLFDVAAFVWFGAFIYLCRSTLQYVWAGIGFFIGIAGALGLIAIEVGLSSGILNQSAMVKPLTYIFIGVLFGHFLLLYATHVSAPEVDENISLGIETALIKQAAKEQAEQILKNNTPMLAGAMAQKIVARALEEMKVNVNNGEVLELPALDVSNVPSVPMVEQKTKMPDFLSWALRGLVKGGRKFESSVPSAGSPSPQLTPKPSHAAGGAEPEDAEG